MVTCDGGCIVLSRQEVVIGSFGAIKGYITLVIPRLKKMEILLIFA